MDKKALQFLQIKHPEVLKELQEWEQNAPAQISVLAPVSKDKYIEALATAGKGMHIDKLVEAVHGIKPGSALFLPNKKRTSQHGSTRTAAIPSVRASLALSRKSRSSTARRLRPRTS